MTNGLGALLLLLLFSPVAVAQDRGAPARGGSGEAVAPSEGGGVTSGSATAVPELLARTPVVARASRLLGAEVMDMSSHGVGHVDDFLVRADGRLVVVVAREDGRLIGLQLAELIARAKADRERGGDVATIKSFKLAPSSRRLGSAPEIEDKARLDAEWWKRLDAHGAVKTNVSEPAIADAAPTAESSAQSTVASDEPVPHLVLKQLLGCAAVDDADRIIGTIRDIVVHVPDARVAYVLVTPASADDTAVARAVPFDVLKSPRGEGGPILISLDAGALDRSPPVADLDRLPVAPFAVQGRSAPSGGTPAAPK
jgi:sporulation protein YlmC with PRC-barrel domain